MKLEEKAFPQKLGDVTQYQWIESGLTKLEYFALHLMTAAVTADAKSLRTETQLAQNAIRLARALARELEAEEGR